jgi:hypothetical protein
LLLATSNLTADAAAAEVAVGVARVCWRPVSDFLVKLPVGDPAWRSAPTGPVSTSIDKDVAEGVVCNVPLCIPDDDDDDVKTSSESRRIARAAPVVEFVWHIASKSIT